MEARESSFVDRVSRVGDSPARNQRVSSRSTDATIVARVPGEVSISRPSGPEAAGDSLTGGRWTKNWCGGVQQGRARLSGRVWVGHLRSGWFHSPPHRFRFYTLLRVVTGQWGARIVPAGAAVPFWLRLRTPRCLTNCGRTFSPVRFAVWLRRRKSEGVASRVSLAFPPLPLGILPPAS